MKEMIRGLFSSSAEWSWGRVGSGVMLLWIIVWINYTIFLSPSPLQVLKETPWMEFASFISSLYLIGKVNETIQARSEK